VVNASSTNPVQLVGFTLATFTGAEGVFSYTTACRAEFPGSRFCTSEEVINTFDVPTDLSGLAWLRPVFVPISTTNATFIHDISGESTNTAGYLSCDGWQNPGLGGLVISASGQFSTSSCSTPNPVACCAPIP
jgi:hypothetical protein